MAKQSYTRIPPQKDTRKRRRECPSNKPMAEIEYVIPR